MPRNRPTPWMRWTAKSPSSSSMATASVRRRATRGAVRVCRRDPNRSSSVATASFPGANTNPPESSASAAITSPASPSRRPRSARTSRARSRLPWPNAATTRRYPREDRSAIRRASSGALPCAEPHPSRPRSTPSANSLRCNWVRPDRASASGLATGPPVHPEDSVRASDSSTACRARSSVRRAWTSTAHEPRGMSSARLGRRSKSSGASPSIPSKARPSANRVSWSRNRSTNRGASCSARARRSADVRSSRTGCTSTAPTEVVDSCVAGTNSRSDSISSPNSSARTGRRAVPGNTSTIPPRTANSPRCSTTSALAYPRPTRRSASSSGGNVVPGANTNGSVSPRVGTMPWSTACAGATTANRPLDRRSERTASDRLPAVSGDGLMPSYGRASHDGNRAARSWPRKAETPRARTSASGGPGATARTGASRAWASDATTKSEPASARPNTGRVRSSSSRSKGSEPVMSSSSRSRLTWLPSRGPHSTKRPRRRATGPSIRVYSGIDRRADSAGECLDGSQALDALVSHTGPGWVAPSPSPGGTGLEPPGELLRRKRNAQVIALRLLASHLAEPSQGLGVLHPLGHHPKAEVSTEVHGGTSDHPVVGVLPHVHHERSIDLDLADGKPPKMAEGGVPGPEVVDRQRDPHLGQEGHHPDRSSRVGHQEALGELERQAGRGDVPPSEELGDLVGELGVEQAPR